MRSFLLSLLCVLTVLPLAGAAQEEIHPPAPQVENIPRDFGVYIKNGDNWDKMYAANRTEVKLGHGVIHGDVTVRYRDPVAPVTSTSARPGILVVGNNETAPRDILIVRLQQKKDHRELIVGSAMVNGNNFKLAYPKEDTFEVEAHDSGNRRAIAPKVDLPPGEYIVFLGASNDPVGYGYDFTVAGK